MGQALETRWLDWTMDGEHAESTHYPSVLRLYPYFLMNGSSSFGPREPYGYCTGLGAGPFLPSIQCRMGVKIYDGPRQRDAP